MDTTVNVSKASKHGRRELHPNMEPPDQPSALDLGMGNTPFTRPTPPEVQVSDKPLEHDFATQLAFNENPVTILANPSADPNAALYIEAWVNGKGVERWFDGIGWVEVKFIPVGEDVIVKRKYLEVWLRSKTMGVHTVEDKADGSEPRNILRRTVSNGHSISIIEDKHPLGREWAKRIMRQGF